MTRNTPQRAAAETADAAAERAAAATAALQKSAEVAVAAALRTAAAGSRSGSLHITSCKMIQAGPDSAAILQAIPASKLTSLEVNYDFWKPRGTPEEMLLSDMLVLGQTIQSLQQLRQLRLSSDYETEVTM
jgi:hypothetical protein